MPPTRRARNSSGPAARNAQKTLSFSTSTPASKAKVTKPSTSTLISTKSLSNIDPEDLVPKPKDVGHISSESAIAEQASVEVTRTKIPSKRTAEEERASKVTDAQVKRYWKAREGERLSKRVHQEDLSVEEKVCRLFDMSSQYGPAIGIARMKRWVRANKLGLAPPIEVLAVLMKEEENGNSNIERAHVDELMSSKFVIGEA